MSREQENCGELMIHVFNNRLYEIGMEIRNWRCAGLVRSRDLRRSEGHSEGVAFENLDNSGVH